MKPKIPSTVSLHEIEKGGIENSHEREKLDFNELEATPDSVSPLLSQSRIDEITCSGRMKISTIDRSENPNLTFLH